MDLILLGQNFKQYLDYKGLSLNKVSHALNMSPSQVFNIVNGKKFGSDKLLEIINHFQDLNPNWLLTGEGEMLSPLKVPLDVPLMAENSFKTLQFERDNEKSNMVTQDGYLDQKKSLKTLQFEVTKVNEEQEQYYARESIEGTIPLVDLKASAGWGGSSWAITEQDVKAQYVIPKFQDKKVDFMIEVYGSSMYPKYNSGDIIACKIIKQDSFIQWNKVHVIATKDQGILVKRLKKSEDPLLLLCHSDNKDYEPFLIPREEIEGIALVIGVIRLE